MKHIFDIKQAKLLNPRYMKRLNLEKNPPWDLDPSTDEFAWKTFEFQLEDKQVEKGLAQLNDDGIFGPATYQAYKKVYENKEFDIDANVDYIFFDGKRLPIRAKVITPNESGGLCFEDFTKPGQGYSNRASLQHCKIIATHHDAAISVSSAFNVLVKRKLSTAFNIAPDGTIYQHFKDPAKVIPWATGNLNKLSIPVDVNSVVEPKYAGLLKKRGMKIPPILTRKCQGATYKFLALTDEQQFAAFELFRVLCDYLDVPLRVPTKGGKYLDKYDEYVLSGTKSQFAEEGGGVVAHYHASKKKWDPIGLDLFKLV